MSLIVRPADAPSLTARSGVLRAYLPVGAAVGLLALGPVLAGGSRYLLAVGTLMLVLMTYGVAFNVAFGGTGQLLLAVGALAAIAGYGVALLPTELGWPLPVAVAAGVVLAAGGAAGLSWVSVRRRLDTIFVGVITITASLVVHNLLLGNRALTGGETGLVVAPGSGTPLRDPVVGYYLLLGVLTVALAGHRALQRSSLGWAFRAIRDDADAAALAGVDVARTKVLAATYTGALAGLAGGAFALVEGFISPTTYAFATVDVRVMVVVAFGGIGTLLGPVVGGAAVTLLDELLRPLGQLRVAVYGGALLLLFLGLPRGVVPAWTRRWQWWAGRRARAGRGVR